jgi:YesN/AraC family two-component response regulator
MYRVILVDDEPWTLQGIYETFEWNKYDLEVIGTYTLATKALQEILEKKPDVVFTDIRMPIISGIDILNTIRKNGLKTEVVIISGFGQFDYAQEAIRQGAFDYILKPIDEEATDVLLERIKLRLDQKQEEKNRKIIEMIIEEPDEIVPEQYGLSNKYPNYQVIEWVGNDKQALDAYLKQVKDIEFFVITMSNKNYYIVNCNNDLSVLMKQQEFSGTIGISNISSSASDIPKLITQAAVAAADVFITNKVGTYCYREKQSQKLVPLAIRITKILDEGQLIDFGQLIEKIPQLFLENQYSMEDLSFLWNRITMHVELISRNKTVDSVLDLVDWQQIETKYDGIEGMCQALINEVQYCYGATDFDMSTDSDSGSANFSKLLKYIHQHYNEQIKLKDLSQMFYINKNYACFLFKRYTGMTFSELLNKIRMEQAKEMLVITSYTIAEISEKSGYTDYFYFSKLFKKMYGVTPSQYRQKPVETADRLVIAEG